MKSQRSCQNVRECKANDMTRIVLFLVCMLGSVRLMGQTSYGFGSVVAKTKADEDRVYKTIFFTDIVNLDSLSGRSNNAGRSLHHRRKEYTRAVNRWVRDMIEAQQPGLTKQAELTNLNQIELHPDFQGPNAKRARRLNKKLGIEKKIVFMDRMKAEKLRSSMLRNANSDVAAKVVLLAN